MQTQSISMQPNQTRVPMHIKIKLLSGGVELQCTVTVRPKRSKIQVSLDEPSSVWSVTFQPQQNKVFQLKARGFSHSIRKTRILIVHPAFDVLRPLNSHHGAVMTACHRHTYVVCECLNLVPVPSDGCMIRVSNWKFN